MVLNSLRKPRILLYIDTPGWAFLTIAHAIRLHLSHTYDFHIMAGSNNEPFNDADFDLIHVFFDRETRHRPFLNGHAKVLKSVYNHEWQIEGQNPMDTYMQNLREAHAISVPNHRLLSALSVLPVPVYLCPEGVDTNTFFPAYEPRSGPLVAGWVGNPARAIKRFNWVKQACDGVCELQIANGDLDERDMADFYRNIDVILCASKAEGSPRPLLEGMACGNFPISFDVGITREIIEDGINGMIVRDESMQGLRLCLESCSADVENIRRASALNPELMRAHRDWRMTIPAQARAYDLILNRR